MKIKQDSKIQIIVDHQKSVSIYNASATRAFLYLYREAWWAHWTSVTT